MSFLQLLPGAVVMGPMTKGSNLPYRRLCVELGARITVSEMALARRLRQKRRSEFALIRRAPEEACFGVQLAGNRGEELAWAAGLVEERGADFVDINFGCPIDRFTRIGLGASLARQPGRVRRLVEAVKAGVKRVPVTAKFRLGWDDEHRNFVDVARAAVDGGADALSVHGRTRDARYRRAADWDAIGEVVGTANVPVIGNGDILFPADAEAGRRRSGCAAVMVARGILIKPWICREVASGAYEEVSADARLGLYRRYVELALEHWGDDERGRRQVREFTLWHIGFWCRYAPRRPDGSWPGMQEREPGGFARTPLEALLARDDETAHEWIVDRLLAGNEVDPAVVPPPGESRAAELREVEG
jgi:tRNA-dihydrouridine synthase 3